jgi:hypothetical protein
MALPIVSVNSVARVEDPLLIEESVLADGVVEEPWRRAQPCQLLRVGP